MDEPGITDAAAPVAAAHAPRPRLAPAADRVPLPARTLYRFRIIVDLRTSSRPAPLRSLPPLAWLRLLSRSGFHAGGVQSHPPRGHRTEVTAPLLS